MAKESNASMRQPAGPIGIGFKVLSSLICLAAGTLLFAKMFDFSLLTQNPTASGELAPIIDASTRRSGGIHSVDFLTFVYASNCSKENPNSGFTTTIRTSNGQWKAGSGVQEVYFAVADGGVIYGDLDADGQDEAVVHTACGFTAGTGWYDEIFVFRISSGRPRLQLQLLSRLSDLDWEQNSLGFAWRVTGVRVKGGALEVTYLAGGSHAQPAWIATTKLRWDGKHFVRAGEESRPFTQ